MPFLQRASARGTLFVLFFLIISLPLSAHVAWTHVNQIDPAALGIYHFDEASVNPGNVFRPIAGLAADRGLNINAPTSAGMLISNDLQDPFFAPHSLQIRSTQLAQSTATLVNLSGDLTIEFWFKWDAGLTSQSLRVGLSSGANLLLARDSSNPANDRFGVALTHGDFTPAPGFSNWPAVGIEEAPFGDWLHIALTIHSTGMHLDTTLAHDVYNAGSTARFWLNGHLVGVGQHTVDIAGLRAHDASRLRIQSLNGAIRLDEVAIWSKDWSQDGAMINPFAEGRGSGLPNAAGHWLQYR